MVKLGFESHAPKRPRGCEKRKVSILVWAPFHEFLFLDISSRNMSLAAKNVLLHLFHTGTKNELIFSSGIWISIQTNKSYDKIVHHSLAIYLFFRSAIFREYLWNSSPSERNRLQIKTYDTSNTRSLWQRSCSFQKFRHQNGIFSWLRIFDQLLTISFKRHRRGCNWFLLFPIFCGRRNNGLTENPHVLNTILVRKDLSLIIANLKCSCKNLSWSNHGCQGEVRVQQESPY